MQYPTHNHIGKVSWDISKHMDRESEVLRRRKYIEEMVSEYKQVELKNKFTL
jgi:hypothetical protein